MSTNPSTLEVFSFGSTLDSHKLNPEIAEDPSLHVPLILGDKAFFEKKGLLIDGSLTDKEIGEAMEVKKLSSEFYTLQKVIASHNLVWLAQDKPIIFKHQSRVYKLVG
jgi:hypothetical protein